MTPLVRRCDATSGAVSTRAVNPSAVLSTTRRLKWLSESSSIQWVRRVCSSSRSVASAVTVRPAVPRPNRAWRTTASLRRKAAAAGSASPRRRSSVSGESAARVCSLRYRVKRCVSSRSAWLASCGLGTDSATRRSGSEGAVGAKDATAKAPPPPPSSTAAITAVMRLGCRWTKSAKARPVEISSCFTRGDVPENRSRQGWFIHQDPEPPGKAPGTGQWAGESRAPRIGAQSNEYNGVGAGLQHKQPHV